MRMIRAAGKAGRREHWRKKRFTLRIKTAKGWKDLRHFDDSIEAEQWLFSKEMEEGRYYPPEDYRIKRNY